MTLPFALHLGLPSGHEGAAADLYWQAFGPKLNRLLGPEACALRMLAAGIRHDHAIAALDPKGRLIGIAGFRDPDGGLTDQGPALMRQTYGLWGATWRRLAFRALEQDVDNTRFLIDGISVARASRGRGVGTALLAALCDAGYARGYREIRLDVLPENLRARSLYEREGFAVVGTQRMGLAGHLIGVAQTLTMVKTL